MEYRLKLLYRTLVNRPLAACLMMGVLALALRAALLPWYPVPLPHIHDEFSYLLAADTYASGRITNPPHPLWQHFESFHILVQPTYISKYPPMQGLVMAFGQRVFHQPWIGVWLSAGIMCAVICWMLQGWTSPGWALLGGLLSVTQLGVLGYWTNSYWGGAVAAIGGAMVLGAMPRIARRRQFGHAVTLGAGLVILMNSRPYDGFVLASIAVPVLLWWLWKSKVPVREVGLRVAVPVALIMIVAGAAMAYQNYRVTGSPLELPYQAYDKQYAASSMFLWTHPRTDIVYRHEVLRKFWLEWDAGMFENARRNPGGSFLINMAVFYVMTFGLFPFLLPILVWPFALKTTEEKITLLILVVVLASLFPLAGFAPHYMAPTISLLFLRLLQGFERFTKWQPAGKHIGLATSVIMLSLMGGQFLAGIFDATGKNTPSKFDQGRIGVIQKLGALPGRHLVVVRYRPDHDVHQEWVYNRADIDGSAIVWAREMGEEADRPLFRYFKDRHAWLLQPDEDPPKLTPYSARDRFNPALSSQAFGSDGRLVR